MTTRDIIVIFVFPAIGYLIGFFKAFRTVQRWFLKKRYLEGHWNGKLTCCEDSERFININIYISINKGEISEGVLLYDQHRNSVQSAISCGVDEFVCIDDDYLSEFQTQGELLYRIRSLFSHEVVLRFKRRYDDPHDEQVNSDPLSYWHYFEVSPIMRLFTVSSKLISKSVSGDLSFSGIITRKSS